MTTPTQIQAINEYSRRKFIAIPIIGKRPFFKRWTEIDHVPHDLRIFAGKNIGILTGQPSKLTVLDIDIQDNGLAHWNKIRKLYPSIITPTVSTPGRGLHLYFRYNSKLSSTSKLHLNGQTIGWDVLNNGRQVVAPPSTKYRWVHSLETPLAKMPQWLEHYLILLAPKST